MTLHSLPLFVRLAGRPVILVGDGEAAAAKRRLLERAGAVVVGEDGLPEVPAPHHPHHSGASRLPPSPGGRGKGAAAGGGKGEGDRVPQPHLAIVALDDDAQARAAVARLRARGILVNAVDRSELCDFTLPALVDRSPVLLAIGTGGVSAGLAAALRQRLEALLPAGLGRLAEAMNGERGRLRALLPDPDRRRRAIAAALGPGGALDLLAPAEVGEVAIAIAENDRPGSMERIVLTSPDPDELTLRQARWLASATTLLHRRDVPPAILDRARADAVRIAIDGAWPQASGEGLTVIVEPAA